VDGEYGTASCPLAFRRRPCVAYALCSRSFSPHRPGRQGCSALFGIIRRCTGIASWLAADRHHVLGTALADVNRYGGLEELWRPYWYDSVVTL
jgi:hypothetical protein